MSESEAESRTVRRTFTEKMGFSDSLQAVTITKSDAVFAVITVFIISVVSVSYIWVLTNVEALKAMIEAEATILGFFGLIAVYWLTSMDSRIDRLEQEKHEYEMKKLEAETVSIEVAKPTTSNIDALTARLSSLTERIGMIQKRKENMTQELSTIGVMLVISLVASIGLLGFQSTLTDALRNIESPFAQLVGLAAGLPTMLFLESTWFIFSLLRRMGKNK